MALITIARVHDMTLAHVVRMNLEASDIPVHLGSEGFASLLGAASAFTAVRVQVPEAFEERARTLYYELMRALESDDPDPEDPADG